MKNDWRTIGGESPPTHLFEGEAVGTVDIQRRGAFGLYGRVFTVPAEVVEAAGISLMPKKEIVKTINTGNGSTLNLVVEN